MLWRRLSGTSFLCLNTMSLLPRKRCFYYKKKKLLKASFLLFEKIMAKHRWIKQVL